MQLMRQPPDNVAIFIAHNGVVMYNFGTNVININSTRTPMPAENSFETELTKALCIDLEASLLEIQQATTPAKVSDIIFILGRLRMTEILNKQNAFEHWLKKFNADSAIYQAMNNLKNKIFKLVEDNKEKKALLPAIIEASLEEIQFENKLLAFVKNKQQEYLETKLTITDQQIDNCLFEYQLLTMYTKDKKDFNAFFPNYQQRIQWFTKYSECCQWLSTEYNFELYRQIQVMFEIMQEHVVQFKMVRASFIECADNFLELLEKYHQFFKFHTHYFPEFKNTFYQLCRDFQNLVTNSIEEEPKNAILTRLEVFYSKHQYKPEIEYNPDDIKRLVYSGLFHDAFSKIYKTKLENMDPTIELVELICQKKALQSWACFVMGAFQHPENLHKCFYRANSLTFANNFLDFSIELQKTVFNEESVLGVNRAQWIEGMLDFYFPIAMVLLAFYQSQLKDSNARINKKMLTVMARRQAEIMCDFLLLCHKINKTHIKNPGWYNEGFINYKISFNININEIFKDTFAYLTETNKDLAIPLAENISPEALKAAELAAEKICKEIEDEYLQHLATLNKKAKKKAKISLAKQQASENASPSQPEPVEIQSQVIFNAAILPFQQELRNAAQLVKEKKFEEATLAYEALQRLAKEKRSCTLQDQATLELAECKKLQANEIIDQLFSTKLITGINPTRFQQAIDLYKSVENKVQTLRDNLEIDVKSELDITEQQTIKDMIFAATLVLEDIDKRMRKSYKLLDKRETMLEEMRVSLLEGKIRAKERLESQGRSWNNNPHAVHYFSNLSKQLENSLISTQEARTNLATAHKKILVTINEILYLVDKEALPALDVEKSSSSLASKEEHVVRNLKSLSQFRELQSVTRLSLVGTMFSGKSDSGLSEKPGVNCPTPSRPAA